MTAIAEGSGTGGEPGATDAFGPVADEIRALSAHLDAATHRLLGLVRAFDASADWGGMGIKSCAHWLSWQLGLSSGAARERVRVARALGTLPQVDGAMSRGEVSYCQVRAMTRVATAETEARLLGMARQMTGAQLEKLCARVRAAQQARKKRDPMRSPEGPRRWVVSRDGDGDTARVVAQLLPDEAALVMQAVDLARAYREPSAGAGERAGEPRTQTPARRPSRADGLVRMAEAFVAAAGKLEDVSAETREAGAVVGEDVSAEPREAGAVVGEDASAETRPVLGVLPGRPGGERMTILVHLAAERLAPGSEAEAWEAQLDDGGRIGGHTLRRIACDAGLAVVTEDGEGRVLDVGRRQRTIPPAIRRALLARDRCCRFPGCTHTRWLDAHHIEHWMHGGETRLPNLLHLCGWHHHLVHEGGFALEVLAGGAVRFRTPAGLALEAARRRSPAPDPAAALLATHERAGLAIDAQTGHCGWDGRPVDYNACAAVAMPA